LLPDLRPPVCLPPSWQVCKKGQSLDPNQAAVLRAFGLKTADFTLTLLAVWSAEGEQYEDLVDPGVGGEATAVLGDEDSEEDGDGEEDLQDGAFTLPDDSQMMLPAGM